MADNDLLNIFRLEVDEYLEAMNGALLQVEMIEPSKPEYKSSIVEMNRVAHSMKGAARAVGITIIETLSHHMEDIFGLVLEEKVTLTPERCDTLYDSLDLIQNVMDGDEVDDEVTGLVISRLEAIASTTAQTDSDKQQSSASGQRSNEIPAIVADVDDEIDEEVDESLTTNGIVPIEEKQPRPPVPPMNRQTTVMSTVDSQTIAMRPVEDTVRVTVSKLDTLMGEATELIVARMRGEERQREISALRRKLILWQREWRSVRSMYIRLVRRSQEFEEELNELTAIFRFLESNQRYLLETNRALALLTQSVIQDNLHLTTLSDQLQEEIDAMRLVPFESIVGIYQRLVRDLARDTGKSVKFDVLGGFVEVDKTVLEALKDPIMHLLRNALDHGIELPDVREDKGKSATGRLILSVEQRGSEIVFLISDDGGGIDPQRVRNSIVKNKLLSKNDADNLSDDEARDYIFHTGLSTTDKVTAISGRGLGMDIVRDRVESLRGRVAVNSRLGEGTQIVINVPVSLTRIRCILLEIGNQEYAIPSAVVERMETRSRKEIFTAEGRDMIVVNGEPVPLVSMASVLGTASSINANDDVLSMLMLKSSNRHIAFDVDKLSSEQELVLKPLGPELARTHFVSGAALLGTGDVIIVLDSNDLTRAATGSFIPKRRSPVITTPVVTQRRLRILVADDSITTRTLEKNILETAGFEVHVAMDGAEAWHMLQEQEFDVVISDVEMPNMNGLELASMIKNSTDYQHVPVVLLTSLGKPEQREAGLRAGADAYLVKSQFDQGELLQTIQSVI